MRLSATINDIALANRPCQLDLLASVVNVLESSPAVSHLLVRGSLAAGQADRSSDVDMVIGVRDAALKSFLEVLDTLVRTELGSLFPGWRDSLAPNIGGEGFVYLVPFQNALYELDLYVVSESSVPSIANRGATILFAGQGTSYTNDVTSGTDAEDRSAPVPILSDVALDIVVEILVLLHMISKRVTRRQWFIVYGHTYLLNDAVRRLMKHCLAFRSRHWGWYHLEEELAGDPRGDSCLRELADLVSAPPIRNSSALQEMYTRIERVINCVAPELWSGLEQEREAYRHFMGVL